MYNVHNILHSVGVGYSLGFLERTSKWIINNYILACI